MFSKDVKTKDGNVKHVVAGSEAELDEAVKLAKSDAAPVYPNINHPVQKGHDLVAVDEDVNQVLVNGEGAHNSPYNAIDDNGSETGEKDVKASGLDEPAYKTVPVGDNDRAPVETPSDAEVAAAKKDSKPANKTK